MTRITFYRSDDYSRLGLERVYAYYDHLHDIASEGHVREVTTMTSDELIEYLNEVCYTLEETILEIRAHEARLAQVLPDAPERSDRKEEINHETG